MLEVLDLDGIPFQPDPSPESIFPTEQLLEGEKRLVFSAMARSISVLIGETGSGKSTTLRKASYTLEEKGFRVLYSSESSGGAFTILRSLHFVLGLKPPLYKADLSQKFLDACRSIDEPLVVIVDEGQFIREDGLQQLRLLTNREFDTKPPFALILAGCPDLKDVLDQPRMTSLRKRVLMSYQLHGLSEDEARPYLEHHLKRAGARRKLFDAAVIHELFGYSRGNLRTFNQLALTALIVTATDSKSVVGLEQLRKAVQELEARP